MSYSLDVNLLLYASNLADPNYPAATSFLRDCLDDPELLVIGYPTVMAYLRIATHSGIFPKPLEPAQALANIESLAARRQVRLVSEREGFLDTYRHLTGEFAVRGNLVSDAHLATLLHQHGVKVLYTNDADFRKFDFLTVKNPF
ncbi:MAG: PIN domain-containing protein [Candidatus Eremiobacteraeota bacterium]|nr:PIN domain-containing protein [Candidatus Eremiobacteraeota bacterium]